MLQSAPRQSPSQAVHDLVASPTQLAAAQCEVAAQSVRATEQLTPVQPAEHTQRGGSSPTSTHLPFAEQPSPSEHSATEQSAPVQPELHRHWGSMTPLTFTATHSPRWLQSGVPGQSGCEQSRPRQPWSHVHWPDVLLHSPWAVHCTPPRPGHLKYGVEQSRSGPSVQPVRHWQCGAPVSAAVHTPLAGLVQLLLQIGTEQSLGWPAGPVQLAWHRQKGTATVLTHWPLPEHAGLPGQSGISQAKPVQPTGQGQRGEPVESSQIARPLHAGVPGQ